MDLATATTAIQVVQEPATGGLGESPRWYVFRSKPRAEERCLQELERAGTPTLCPMVLEYRHRRRRKERAPLFPGYVFARFSWPDAYHQVRWLSGISNLVRFGDGTPPHVAEDLIAYFAARTNADGVLDLTDEYRPGDPVRILSEPFRGLVGQIVRADTASRRVVVLMEFLSQATMEIDACQVRAL